MRSRQRHSCPLPLPAGQLIPQHTLAAVVFDKFTPRPGFPPKVAVFDHNLSTVAGFSLGGQRAKGKWQPPKEAGLPGELPDALPFQQPLAAQHTLTGGVLATEPQQPRWTTKTRRGGGGKL